MRISIRFGMCIALSTLSACGSNVSRPQFISDTGVTKEVVDAAGDSPLSGGLLYHFKLAEEAARPYDRQSGRLVLGKSDPEKQRQFMEAGFALIQARCNKYILAKSDHQRQVNVWRDTFAPITALLTGAVTLIGNGETTDNDALTALSLGTTAATAGFRIYEQRYLFGAENVNSVRLLIQAALADNAAVAMNIDPKTRTYAQSVTHLINNQAVCSPGHILQLVSAAIKTGKPESEINGEKPSASTDSKGEKADKADGDTKAKAALLDQLKKDKAVTDDQITAAQAKIAAVPIAPPPPVTIPDGQVAAPTPTLKIVTTGIRNE